MTALHDSMVETPVPYEAAGVGLLTTAFYSVPDFISSRPARALVKTGIIAGIGALIWHSAPVMDAECDCCCNHDEKSDTHCEDCVSADDAAELDDDPCACVDRPNPDDDCDCDKDGECACGDNCWCIHADDEIVDTDELESRPMQFLGNLRERPLASAVIIGGAAAATVAISVLGEKLVYKAAERRKARGVRLPHTKQGLLIGLAAAGATVLAAKFEESYY